MRAGAQAPAISEKTVGTRGTVRRLFKIAAFSIFSVLAVLLIAAVAFYVRLAQGPVALDFMRDEIQAQINRNLSGMSVSVGGVVVERSADTGVPHFRLRNITLQDSAGNLIARAPRAAIGIREEAIFRGSVVPTSIELIGPRIRVMRNLEGQVELGFGEAAPETESVTVGEGADDPGAKTDQEQPGSGVTGAGGAASLIRILSGESAPGAAEGRSTRSRRSASLKRKSASMTRQTTRSGTFRRRNSSFSACRMALQWRQCRRLEWRRTGQVACRDVSQLPP